MENRNGVLHCMEEINPAAGREQTVEFFYQVLKTTFAGRAYGASEVKVEKIISGDGFDPDIIRVSGALIEFRNVKTFLSVDQSCDRIEIYPAPDGIIQMDFEFDRPEK